MSDKERKPRRRRTLTRDDRALWSSFTKTIAPLPDRVSVAAGDEDDGGPAEPPPQRPAPHSPKARPAPAKSAPALAPLDRRAKKRVASGRDAIDGRLDLHGHTQSEAHAELLRFLDRAAGRGWRLVLVITGKSGVLRRQVPLWLALPEVRSLVIGFETAHAAHGGEGALYVRLRRPR